MHCNVGSIVSFPLFLVIFSKSKAQLPWLPSENVDQLSCSHFSKKRKEKKGISDFQKPEFYILFYLRISSAAIFSLKYNHSKCPSGKVCLKQRAPSWKNVIVWLLPSSSTNKHKDIQYPGSKGLQNDQKNENQFMFRGGPSDICVIY